MAKTIIISAKLMESIEMKEVALASSLPKEIRNELNGNKTPLSSNPSFPEEYGDSFEKQLTYRRFKETKDELYNIGIIFVNDWKNQLEEISKRLPIILLLKHLMFLMALLTQR